jgi:hypothetical protein
MRRGIISSMSRRRLPWLVAVPLIVGGSFSAHGLSYRIVAPDTGARAQLLEQTGHGYLDHAPLAIAILLALLVAGLGLRAARTLRGGISAPLSAWLFFSMPLVGFALQEHLERLFHDGSFPLGAVLEPTFLVGLLLQLPFALAAYVVAWALLEVAERIGPSLRASPPGRWPSAQSVPPPQAQVEFPRIPALALGRPQRGPPLL